MNFYDAAWQLADLLETNRTVFLKLDPEVPDFTTAAPFKITIWGTRQKVELDVTSENITSVVGLLDATIFDKDQVDRLYAWNIKSLASYFLFFTQKFIAPANSIIDLKPIENFLGIKKNPPENLVEVVNRTKLAVRNKDWLPIYKSVHLPLSLRVLPSIETTPLLNEQARRCEYPYYEIEGQLSGRMNCLSKFLKSYMPHRLGPDVTGVLKPRGYGLRFLCSDFRHCEVNVLQWLSGDAKLNEILESGIDLHEKIYEIITRDDCNTDNKRKLSKKMFLPVMYGCGPKGLADNLGTSETTAAELISRIRIEFSTAWEWMKSKQELAKHGVVTDFFGRPRQFDPQQSYQARNFVVQGVAATACQERLIQLYNALDGVSARLAFSIHDGFGLIIKLEAARETYKLVKGICETESTLCPGLRMKVEIKFGIKLDSMKVLWRD